MMGAADAEARYRAVLWRLEAYFASRTDVKNWKKLFLNGGCFWFAQFLHWRIRNSCLMINRAEEHCALAFGEGLYDITRQVSKYNFHPASEREIRFMKKNYIPRFDVKKLEQYLESSSLADTGFYCYGDLQKIS